MTHQNLVLTEEAIKGHCKRLKKELKNLNQDLPLTQVQNLFAKTLGFNHFHELKKVFNNESSSAFRVIDGSLKIGKEIPIKYIHNPITKKKEDMLEYVLLDQVEVLEHKIPKEFVDLVDLIITSSLDKVKKFININNVDLNYQIPKRTWTPKNILDFAIFFEQYDILLYLLKIRTVDLNLSQEYLLGVEAQHNNLELFKYLCSVLPYTQYALNMALLYASNHSLDILKYLLTNKELKFNANVHHRSDWCLKNAVACGKLDIVKYLLTSSELIEKPSLYSKLDASMYKDIRDTIIHKIRIYTNKLQDADGKLIKTSYTELERKNFFTVLNYLIHDYNDEKLIYWFYQRKELRPYIDKNKFHIEKLLDALE